ncbi:hypothetical protein PAMA_013653 [Pampus argenteus]
MKKLWIHVCLLVLAAVSISRGHTQTDTDEDTQSTVTPPPVSPENGNTSSSSVLTASSSVLTASSSVLTVNSSVLTPFPPSENYTSTNATDLLTTGFTEQETTATAATTATTSSSPTSETIKDKDSSSWGYVILVLIVLVIVALCVILYLLRRVSRTYSFDLHRPSPTNHHNEPTGVFEIVNLDELDQPAPRDQITNGDLSPPPVANGTTLQSEEKEDNALQEEPDANGLETSSITANSPSADDTSEQMGCTMFFDAMGDEQQNENNNPCETVCIDVHDTMEPSSGLLQ